MTHAHRHDPRLSARRARRTSRLSLIAVVSAIAVAGGAASASADPASAPLSLSTPGHLQAMSAVSASDLWAVGYAAPAGSSSVTRAEHWNGRSWRQVATPVIDGSTQSDLDGVSADTASDVWAVGSYVDQSGTGDTLAEHWDGTAWVQVPTPNPSGSSYSVLSAVVAVSPTSVWADGIYLASQGYVAPLLEHWNGHAWKIVDTAGAGRHRWHLLQRHQRQLCARRLGGRLLPLRRSGRHSG